MVQHLCPRLGCSESLRSFSPSDHTTAHAYAHIAQSIKYGVTTVDNLCSDLLQWNTLYLSGRMHKPIRIIKDDARVRLTQQVNLVSALRVALLTLPEHFEEDELFARMAGFSYAGDPRMVVPGAENRGKVGNIVRAQSAQFRELYQRLANGLPGVHWAAGSSSIQVRFPLPSSAFFTGIVSSRLVSSTDHASCNYSKTPPPAHAPPSSANSPQTSSTASSKSTLHSSPRLAPTLHRTRTTPVHSGVKSPRTRNFRGSSTLVRSRFHFLRFSFCK